MRNHQPSTSREALCGPISTPSTPYGPKTSPSSSLCSHRFFEKCRASRPPTRALRIVRGGKVSSESRFGQITAPQGRASARWRLTCGRLVAPPRQFGGMEAGNDSPAFINAPLASAKRVIAASIDTDTWSTILQQTRFLVCQNHNAQQQLLLRCCDANHYATAAWH